MATTVEKPKEVDVHFPMAGLDRSDAFFRQRAREVAKGKYARTCPQAENVRGFDPDAERGRGGSRPGLEKYISARPGNTEYILQDLAMAVHRSEEAV